MAAYTLPYFGAIDPAALDEYYDVDIKFEEEEVQIDLNFNGNTIDAKRLDKAKNFIDNLPHYNKANLASIKADIEDGDTVKLYIEHHLEDIPEEELASLVDAANTSISREEQLLAKLHLVRVGLYPDSEEQFAIFDYSIGRDLTQYLVVLNTDENGVLEYMTMES